MTDDWEDDEVPNNGRELEEEWNARRLQFYNVRPGLQVYKGVPIELNT